MFSSDLQEGSPPDPMFPDRHIPASARISRLLALVPDVPNGTALSEKDAQYAIENYIKKLEKVVSTEPERLCRCCQKPESMWLQNEDLGHLYFQEDICQACESIISWANDSPAQLELIAAYIRLLEKERETE